MFHDLFLICLLSYGITWPNTVLLDASYFAKFLYYESKAVFDMFNERKMNTVFIIVSHLYSNGFFFSESDYSVGSFEREGQNMIDDWIECFVNSF